VTEPCVVTALVFSGRPDPDWPLGARQVDGLRGACLGLPRRGVAAPRPPALGYRGVALRCASGEEWCAFGGVVSYRNARGAIEHRPDDQRSFEKMLLATAPKGAVPPGIPAIDDLRRR
jgi:hypothetical protein